MEAGGDAGIERALTALAVSYHVLAKALLGIAGLEEAAELHSEGVVTDEVVLFVAECNGFNVDIRSILPDEAVEAYLDVLARIGGPASHALSPTSLTTLLAVMSGLAESDLRGLEGAAAYRLELSERVIAPLIDALKALEDDCARLLAGALESLAELEAVTHRR